MSTFTELRTAIRTVADARGIPGSIGLRTPGDPVKYKDQQLDTGTAWGENKSFEILVQGIANYLDTLGVGGVKDKLNELIAGYNQLLTDYNAPTFPSTAEEVEPLQ